MKKTEWKIVAATLILVGSVLTIFGWIFGSEEVVFHKNKVGDSIKFIGQLLLVVAPIIYVLLDIKNLKERIKKLKFWL
jgi:hypothetical protein